MTRKEIISNAWDMFLAHQNSNNLQDVFSNCCSYVYDEAVIFNSYGWINVDQTLPKPQDINDIGNDYYDCSTENYGFVRAMYLVNDEGEEGWYTNYISKLIIPVKSWRIVKI